MKPALDWTMLFRKEARQVERSLTNDQQSYAKTSEVVDNVDEEKWSGRVDLNHIGKKNSRK